MSDQKDRGCDSMEMSRRAFLAQSVTARLMGRYQWQRQLRNGGANQMSETKREQTITAERSKNSPRFEYDPFIPDPRSLCPEFFCGTNGAFRTAAARARGEQSRAFLSLRHLLRKI